MILMTEIGDVDIMTPTMKRRGRRIKALADLRRAVGEWIRWEIWVAMTNDEEGAAADLRCYRGESQQALRALRRAG